jgi:hypothetical protein
MRRPYIIFHRESTPIDRALDAEMCASTAMVFILGMMHMETLLRQKIGRNTWQAFVQSAPPHWSARANRPQQSRARAAFA